MLEKTFLFLNSMGILHMTIGHLIMVCVALILLYLGIAKKYEPLLLVPIGFGMLLINLPLTGLMEPPVLEFGEHSLHTEKVGGLLYYLFQGDELGIFPPLIFMGVGAMTDFGPLLADPRSILLGAAAQFGIFTTFFGAIFLGYTFPEAASIGIVGGADGPTTIYLTSMLAPHMLAATAVAAYSYMALVPIIQPPIMKLLTTKEERRIVMEQLREVSKRERILFPIMSTIVVLLLLPAAAPLVGMLMLGNLFRECGVTGRLADTSQNALINIVTIFLGITVGASASAEAFLNLKTLGIMILGILAFAVGTGTGVLLAKLMNALSTRKINPLIGSAGVSA
ncbi:MAG: sodium ion-translocating decarboxylase subunit beta, partial [Desulfovermiculus sp.]